MIWSPSVRTCATSGPECPLERTGIQQERGVQGNSTTIATGNIKDSRAILSMDIGLLWRIMLGFLRTHLRSIHVLWAYRKSYRSSHEEGVRNRSCCLKSVSRLAIRSPPRASLCLVAKAGKKGNREPAYQLYICVCTFSLFSFRYLPAHAQQCSCDCSLGIYQF